MPGAENNENIIESNNKMHEFIKNLTKKVDSVVTIAGEVSLINQDEISATYSKAKPYDTYRDTIRILLLKRRSCFDEMAKLREKNNGSINKECENYLQEIKTIDADLIEYGKGMYNTYARDNSKEADMIDIIRALPINVCIQVNNGYKEGFKPKILRDYSDSNEISMEKFYDLTQIPSDVLYDTVNHNGKNDGEERFYQIAVTENGESWSESKWIDYQSSRAYILSELNVRRLDSIEEQLNTTGDGRNKARNEAKKELTKLVNSIRKHDPNSISLRDKDLTNLKKALGEINKESLGIKDKIRSLLGGRDGKNTLLKKLDQIESQSKQTK